MATDLTFYDSAWPVVPPPETDGVAGYIGGDTPHVWTVEEWAQQHARYRLPIFTRSNPRGIAGVVADVNAAVAQLHLIGAPRGCLVGWDMETAADKTYIAGVYTGLAAKGWKLIVYGSDSTIMGNDNPDGLYWAADWTGVAHMAGGAAITQWVSFAKWDEEEAKPGLPFWDTQAGPPKPPVKPAPPAAVREWTTAGMDSLAELAAQQHAQPSTVLRMTAEHSPGAMFATPTADWLDAVFAGHVLATDKMPVGLTLYLPRMTLTPLPGDFAVVSMGGTGGRVISALEGIAYGHGTYWDHAFIYVGDREIVQAEPAGACEAPLGTYGHTIWSTGLLTPTPDQRAKIVSSALWFARNKVGYSWLDYAAIGAHRFHVPVPGLRGFIARSDRLICSQLVDQVWRSAGFRIFTDDRWAGYVSPYDLGHRLQVLALQHAQAAP